MDLKSEGVTSPTLDLSRRDGTRSDTVYRTLHGWIMEGRIPFEGKLPTENELTQHFHVSRPVVRTAIAKLRDEGLVRSVQGSGTVVIHNPNGDAGALFKDSSPAAAHRKEMIQGSVRDLQRCFEFRLMIESEAAYLAALRHSPASLKRISECVYPASYEFPRETPKPGETLNFHRAVVMAADNHFLEISMDLIMSQPAFQFYLNLRGATRAPDPVEHRTKVNAEHLEILRLIERRQAEDAKDYMRYHIQTAYDALINRIPVTDNS